MKNIAVLLTCHNRKAKTLNCFKTFYSALEYAKVDINFDVFLVDDGSTDGTSEELKALYTDINIIEGSGNLFWSGGMRLAWQTAIKSKVDYDAYLLLNDDVVLEKTFIGDLMHTHQYCLDRYNKSGIYVSSTRELEDSSFSYGGSLVTKNFLRAKTIKLKPSDVPIPCNMANANILLVTSDVVARIGILDPAYIHQFGDYDYTLTASRNNIPILVCPGYGGICGDDHGNSWLPVNSSLSARIKFLYSPLGLGYHEQIHYLRKNFKYQFPYYFTMLWIKTLFPFLWDKYKNKAKI